VLARALQKSPEDRYPNAKAFKDALRAAAGPLSQVPREALGDFVRTTFPDDERRAKEIIDLGRRRYASLVREAKVRAPSRMDRRMSQSGDGLTRTDFIDPSPLARADVALPTRSAPVSRFDGADATLATRTGAPDDLVLPTVIDGAEILPTRVDPEPSLSAATLLLEDRGAVAPTRVWSGNSAAQPPPRAGFAWALPAVILSVGVIAAGAVWYLRSTDEPVQVIVPSEPAAPQPAPIAAAAAAKAIVASPPPAPTAPVTATAPATPTSATAAPVSPPATRGRERPRGKPAAAAREPAPEKPAAKTSALRRRIQAAMAREDTSEIDPIVKALREEIARRPNWKMGPVARAELGSGELTGDYEILLRVLNMLEASEP
jgi:hypothetical protein